MDIQIATLCDFAADYNGKLVVSGTFDTLAARALPVVHPSCALAMTRVTPAVSSANTRAIKNRSSRELMFYTLLGFILNEGIGASRNTLQIRQSSRR